MSKLLGMTISLSQLRCCGFEENKTALLFLCESRTISHNSDISHGYHHQMKHGYFVDIPKINEFIEYMKRFEHGDELC